MLPAANEESFDAVSTGDERYLVAWSRAGSALPWFRTWNGTAWSGEASAPSIGAIPRYLKLAADPAGSQALLMTRDEDRDINLTRWDGTGWQAPQEIEANTVGTGGRAFDVAFEPDGTRALAVWSRAASKSPWYALFDGGSWSAPRQGPDLGNPVGVVQLSPSSSGSEVLAAVLLTGSNGGWALRWDGSSLGDPELFSGNLNGDGGDEAFMISDCPASGLIAHWPLDGDAADATSFANHGTLLNGEGDEWTRGRVGSGALSLDGADDLVRTADSSTRLQLPGSYTTALWIRASSPQVGGAGIYSRIGASSGSEHWALLLDGLGSRLEAAHGGSSWDTGIDLSALAGRWRHVAIVYQAPGGEIRSYLDGSPVRAGTLGRPLTGNGHLDIGASRSGRAFHGKLDDIRIYNRALSPSEVAALFSSAGASAAFTISTWREKRE